MKPEQTLTLFIVFALIALTGNVLVMKFFFQECFQKYLNNMNGSWAKRYSKNMIASGKLNSTQATFFTVDNVSPHFNSDHKLLLLNSKPNVQVEQVSITNSPLPAYVSDHKSLLRNSKPSVQVEQASITDNSLPAYVSDHEWLRGKHRTKIVYIAQGATRNPPSWFVDLTRKGHQIGVWGHYAECDANQTGVSEDGIFLLQICKTTWTSGRNRLYEFAKRSKFMKESLYLIFLDSDASRFELKKKIGPCRTPPIANETANDYFERLLLTERPAMASVNGKGRCGPKKFDGCTADMDAFVAAFHAVVAPILLPYDTTYDKKTWWGSQEILINMAIVLYPTSSVLYRNIEVTCCQKHAKYPRGLLHEKGLRRAEALLRERLNINERMNVTLAQRRKDFAKYLCNECAFDTTKHRFQTSEIHKYNAKYFY